MNDVIVVGAGPAGSGAAIVLAQAGRDVLLIDRVPFPRDKPCGDGIMHTATVELERLGVWDVVQAAHFGPVRRVRTIAPSGSDVTVDLPATSQRGCIAPRKQFDTILQQHAIDSGAVFEVGQVVAPIVEQGRVQGVVVRVETTLHERRAPMVIAADGAHSVLAARLGVQQHFPAYRSIGVRGYVQTEVEQDGTAHMDFLPALLPGYAWVFPVSSRCVNVGLGTTLKQSKRLDRSLSAILDTFLHLPRNRSLLGAGWVVSDVRGWMLNLGGSEKRSRVLPGMVFVGDAGGFVNPATGGGIATALITGRIAGEVVHAALDAGTKGAMDRVVAQFDQRWYEEVLPDLQRGYMLQQLLMGWPGPVNWFVEVARAFPALHQHLAEKIVRFG
jgi:geranylgeranyl reductase family protein